MVNDIDFYLKKFKRYGYIPNTNPSDFWFSKKSTLENIIFGNTGQGDGFGQVIRWKSDLGQCCQKSVREYIENKINTNYAFRGILYKQGITDYFAAEISFDDFEFKYKDDTYNLSSFAKSFPTSQVGGLHDLRGIDLSNIRLQDITLKNCFLSYANFSNSIISQSTFNNVLLGQSNFDNCKIIGIRFTNHCGISGATFKNSFINAVKFSDDLIGEGIIISKITYISLLIMCLKSIVSSKQSSKLNNYTTFLANDTKDINNPKIKGLKSYIDWFQDIHYSINYQSIDINKKSKYSIIFQVITTKYWSSYKVLGGFSILLNFLFSSIIYFFHRNFKYPDELKPFDFFDSFYFSIVTFVTLGYGDITPINWIGQLIVIMCVSSGYIILALFIFLLSKKINNDI